MAPSASQRIVFDLAVCLPRLVLILRDRIAWDLLAGDAGLALALTFAVVPVDFIAWWST